MTSTTIPGTISPLHLEALIVSGQIWPGDIVLMAGTCRGPADWFIRRTQERLLRDLVGKPPSAEAAADLDAAVRYYSRFGHAAMVHNAAMAVEMTRPHARRTLWSERLRPGNRILVRRVAPTAAPMTYEWGCTMAANGAADADRRLRYPFAELYLYYGWSWQLQKLWLGRRFRDVFTRDESDVCSGRVWVWCRDEDPWTDLTTQEARPEGHYPAELAMSPRFRTVLEASVMEDRAK